MKTRNLACWLLPILLVGGSSAQESTSAPGSPAPQMVLAQTGTMPAKPGAASAPGVKLLADGPLAPDFISNDLDGKTVRLSDWKGKVPPAVIFIL